MRATFKSTYASLPDEFICIAKPEIAAFPKIHLYNDSLAKALGLSHLSKQQILTYFSGNESIPEIEPLALAYAGHQFGHYVPLLGDGRAHLVAELITPNQEHFDIQLKGSGRTAFSRRGDGKCPLGPALREFLISEFMHAVGIPTTRSLAVIGTGELVNRERALPGAILTRIAKSHIRVGSFEYAYHLNDIALLQKLADYTILRLDPDLADHPQKYLSFLKRVVNRQAVLIAQWMNIGFVHGVMNTDNMTLSGETIDYGPCAFIDDFDIDSVYSYIDSGGRYAFGQQPSIAYWNLKQLSQSLKPLIDKETVNQDDEITNVLKSFETSFNHNLQQGIRNKLGFISKQTEDEQLVQTLFFNMHQHQLDFTLTFREIMLILEGKNQNDISFLKIDALREWFDQYSSRLSKDYNHIIQAVEKMKKHNPWIIPRNYLVEDVIEAAILGNMQPIKTYLMALQNPFQEYTLDDAFARKPIQQELNVQTFCGT